ncbi:MAG: T9SS type A sorting domain-containing protein [Bacteroidetes bacterium]|nr:T9SS type A sorting domain-containing protein [Bacteroidota bacterium]
MNLYVTVDTQFDQYFYKSTNKGASWFFVSTPPSWPVIYTDYFIPNRIYVFPEPYVSNEGGLSWFLADSGLPDTSYYLSFYQDKETTKLLYNLRRDGLYSSRNDTIYWQLVEGTDELPLDIGSAGFRFADVGQMTNLFINQVNDIIYIGTAQGIYKSSLLTNVKDKVEKIIENFSLSQNYPNPFNPITTISYRVPETSFITIKVYDVLGNEIATLVNEEKQAGSYEVEFQSATGSWQLTSGMYFYQLKVGNYVETKKMVLLK